MITDEDGTAPAAGAASHPRAGTVIELLLLAVLLPSLLLLAQPASAEQILTWLTLVCVLFGVRYGFAAGSCAAVLLMMVLLCFHIVAPALLHEFPKAEAAVCLLAGSLAGQFHDRWARSVQSAQAEAASARLRLEQFNGSLHLLKASHAQLERRLAGSHTSLRGALERLERQLALGPDGERASPGSVGAALLEVFAGACHVHAGSVHAVGPNGRIATAPLASAGRPASLSAFHPLLREALASASVVGVDAGSGAGDEVRVVIPIVDSSDHVHGVVSVSEISFIGMHQHNFDLMAIIARRAGDILASHAALAADAGDPEALAQRLRHCLPEARRQRMPLAAIGLRVDALGAADALLARARALLRGIDQPWLGRDRKGRTILVALMPVPDADAARSRLQRLRAGLPSVESGGGGGFFLLLESQLEPDQAAARILRSCAMDARDASDAQATEDVALEAMQA